MAANAGLKSPKEANRAETYTTPDHSAELDFGDKYTYLSDYKHLYELDRVRTAAA